MSGLGGLLQQVPIPTTASSSTQYPLWLEQSLAGLANAGGALSQTPFQQFPGPQVAAPSPTTQSSWQLAQNNVGNWQPNVGAGTGLVSGSAAPITPTDISTFLNPYQSYITNALNTNLQQNILPGIQDRFVGAGQAASPQQAQLMGQATYGANQAIGQSLAGTYQGALNSLLSSRQQQMAAGEGLGTLGALQGQLGIADVGQLAAAGSAQDQNAQANINSAMQNFNAQQQWPYQNLSFLSDILHGIPYQATGSTTNSTNVNAYQPSPLAAYATGLLGTLGSTGGLKRGGRVAPERTASIHQFPRTMPALQHLRRAA